MLKALAGAGHGTLTVEADVTGTPTANANYQRARQTDVVERVDIRPSEIEVRLTAGDAAINRPEAIIVPWSKRRTRVQRDVIAPAKGQWVDPRAKSSDTRSRLLSAIAVSRGWLEDVVTGRIENIDALAARKGRSARSVSMMISLAFLAPDLVKAIVDHRMPWGIGLAQLTTLPIEWGRQGQARGISAGG